MEDYSGRRHNLLVRSRIDIPRADVAAVLSHILDAPETIGCQFDVTEGEQLIAAAIATAVASGEGESS